MCHAVRNARMGMVLEIKHIQDSVKKLDSHLERLKKILENDTEWPNTHENSPK